MGALNRLVVKLVAQGPGIRSSRPIALLADALGNVFGPLLQEEKRAVRSIVISAARTEQINAIDSAAYCNFARIAGRCITAP